MNETHWAIRTIRHGRVKVGGQSYTPSSQHLVYDGRLDGKRFAFGRYRDAFGLYHPFLSLWGLEAEYRTATLTNDGPEVVDGQLPWVWWWILIPDQQEAVARAVEAEATKLLQS